jgi:hypothetical protein
MTWVLVGVIGLAAGVVSGLFRTPPSSRRACSSGRCWVQSSRGRSVTRRSARPSRCS